MEFDPKAYLEKKSKEDFDPDTYLSSKEKFDPNAYLASKEEFDPDAYLAPKEEKAPSIGKIGKGIGAELAIGEGAKFTGATAGAAIGGPAGAVAGYFIGGISGGVSGSIAAQKIEGRDKISWGRVTADTILNLLPFGTGKGVKGAATAYKVGSKVGLKAGEEAVEEASKRVFPKMFEPTTVAKRFGTGAAISVGAQQIEKGIEEKRFLTPTEALIAGGTGGTLNIGIGALSDSLGDIYKKKFAGKTDEQVNAKYNEGDPDTVAFVDEATGGDPVGKFGRLMKTINSYVIPSHILGNKTSKLIRDYQNQAQAAMDMAGRARKQLNDLTRNYTEEQKKRLDDYMSGNIDEIGDDLLEAKGIIDEVRTEIGNYQKTLVELYEKGVIDINEVTFNKIKKSIDEGNYLRTEYKLYIDPKYQPTQQAKINLRNRLLMEAEYETRQNLKKQGKSKGEIESIIEETAVQRFDEAERKIRTLLDAREDPDALANVFKRKETQSQEMNEFLGIVTDPGERLFGTMSRLGKDLSVQKGYLEIGNFLVKSGIGIVGGEGREIPLGYVPLKINNKLQNKYGQKRITEVLKKPEYEDTISGTRYKSEQEALKAGVPGSRIRKITTESKIDKNSGQQIYVPKEINDSVDVLTTKEFLQESNNWAINLANQLLTTTTGLSKFVKVPLSVAAYPVQFFGNAFMVAGLGMNPFKNFRKNYMIAISDLNTKNVREGKFFGRETSLTLSRLKRLKELDLIDRNVTTSEIRDGVNKGFFGKLLKPITEPIGKAYSIFDTAQRLAVFDSYKEIVRKGLSKNDLAKMSDEAIEELAAELTNATYQNYGRINKSMRFLSRIGVLNEFASFNLEQLRTAFNNGRLTRDLKNGSFSKKMNDEYGVNFDQKFANELGNKRLMASAGYIATATAGISMMNRNNGVSPEEEQALRETIIPEWDRDSKLLIKIDGDKVKTANISYQLPIAELSSAFEAGLRGEDFYQSVGNIFGATWNKMGGSGTMNAQNFFAALNNRDPRTGRPISDEPSGGRRFADLATYYGAETFTPTLLGKTSDKTTPDLILRYTLGLRNQNTTIEGGAGFKIRALRERVNNLRRSYSSDLYYGKDMQQAYNSRNEVYKRNMAEAIKHAENLRILGQTEEQITNIFKKAGLSKVVIQSALDGNITDMPIAVSISGTKQEKKEKLLEQYEKLPPEIGMLMLNQARDSGKIKQSAVNEILRQSQLNQLVK